MPKKRRGRPATDNPKNLRVDVRLTPKELELLDRYCQERGVSRPQGLRDGIRALHANKK
ncbi:ribbon-helix-helix protein, CopG family [Hungatella hathewayi]